MKKIKLELSKQYCHVVGNEEVEIVDLEVSWESYLVNKLIDKYIGTTGLSESIEMLYDLSNEISRGEFSSEEVIDLAEWDLIITNIDDAYVSETIANELHISTSDVKRKMKCGDLVVDHFDADDTEEAVLKYVKAYDIDDEEELAKRIDAGGLCFIELCEGTWVSVENINVIIY